MGFSDDLLGFGGDFMGFHGISWDFMGLFIGFGCDLMRLHGIYGDLKRFSWIYSGFILRNSHLLWGLISVPNFAKHLGCGTGGVPV